MATQQAALPVDFAPIAQSFIDLGAAIASAANGRLSPFAPITLRMPASEPPIHAFYTMVSWLYVMIIENGAVHFRFLSERAAALGLDRNGDLEDFRKNIQILRTVLQHNLSLLDANDVAKLVRCENWMADALGASHPLGSRFWPNRESDWQILALKLRDGAKTFCDTNNATLRKILSDEFAGDILREWIFRETHSMPAHEFDSIIALASTDLGLKHLDPLRVRKIHLEEWNRRLRLVSDDTDPKREARRLVEQTLLSEASNYLPITGEDVIETLGVKPGPEVGKVLLRARDIYRKAPCDRDELLKQLRETRLS